MKLNNGVFRLPGNMVSEIPEGAEFDPEFVEEGILLKITYQEIKSLPSWARSNNGLPKTTRVMDDFVVAPQPIVTSKKKKVYHPRQASARYVEMLQDPDNPTILAVMQVLTDKWQTFDDINRKLHQRGFEINRTTVSGITKALEFHQQPQCVERRRGGRGGVMQVRLLRNSQLRIHVGEGEVI